MKEEIVVWFQRHTNPVLGLLYSILLLKVCYFTLTCQVDGEHPYPAERNRLANLKTQRMVQCGCMAAEGEVCAYISFAYLSDTKAVNQFQARMTCA